MKLETWNQLWKRRLLTKSFRSSLRSWRPSVQQSSYRAAASKQRKNADWHRRIIMIGSGLHGLIRTKCCVKRKGSPRKSVSVRCKKEKSIMRKISLIIIHCSAVRPDQMSSAAQIDSWHRDRGFHLGTCFTRHTPAHWSSVITTWTPQRIVPASRT